MCLFGCIFFLQVGADVGGLPLHFQIFGNVVVEVGKLRRVLLVDTLQIIEVSTKGLSAHLAIGGERHAGHILIVNCEPHGIIDSGREQLLFDVPPGTFLLIDLVVIGEPSGLHVTAHQLSGKQIGIPHECIPRVNVIVILRTLT